MNKCSCYVLFMNMTIINLGLITAGFPSPAADHEHNRLDLLQKLIKRPASTFVFEVQGVSMIQAGIMPGAWLVVDRSITPRNGHTVVAVVNSEFTVKRFGYQNNHPALFSANKQYAPILFKEFDELEIWGVATYCINPLI